MNLKIATLSKFDSLVTSKAKKALWDSRCSNLLSNAGLSYHNVAADLDDILVAKLTNCQRETFCAAVDLVLLSPIVADCNGPRPNL